MFKIGFAFGYHDSSISVSKDSELLGIYSEERFSRLKHDNRFPERALAHAIKAHDIHTDDISYCVYYENAIAKASRIRGQHSTSEDYESYISKIYREKYYKLDPVATISENLGISKSKVFFTDHHASHVFTALSLAPDALGSNASELVALTLDGVGEYTTGTLSNLKALKTGYSFPDLGRFIFPNSLGLFYSAITSFLGFEVNDAEYKVMGLAAFGEPEFVEELKRVLHFDSVKNEIVIDEQYFDFSPTSKFPYSPLLISLIGAPFPNSKVFAEKFSTLDSVREDKLLERCANIACSAQEVITDCLVKFVGRNVKPSKLFYSGGVALNTKANSHLFSQVRSYLFIPPDPGDGGSSLGAINALSYRREQKIIKLNTPYQGLDLANGLEKPFLDKFDGIIYQVYNDFDEIIEIVAEEIAMGKVIGWCQDRAEFGPRALGNRSILADPRSKNNQEYVNKAIKFREPFRPFAPSVLDSHIDELFDTKSISHDYINSPLEFMLTTLNATPLGKSLIPACIHVDGTSRVHKVSRRLNSKFFMLISKFYDLTGCPALLNTSFNLRGEPIVNDSHDAITTFIASGMDYLVLNNYVVSKK